MQSIDLVPNLVRGYDRRNFLAGNGLEINDPMRGKANTRRNPVVTCECGVCQILKRCKLAVVIIISVQVL